MVEQATYDKAVKVMETLKEICLNTSCPDCPFYITEKNYCLIGKIRTPISVAFSRTYLQKPKNNRFKPALCKLICALEEAEAFVTTVCATRDCATRDFNQIQTNSFDYNPFLQQLVVRIGNEDENRYFEDGLISPNDRAVCFTKEIINEEIRHYRDSIGEKKMTNKEKFIEIMNQTFNAGLYEDNIDTTFGCPLVFEYRKSCSGKEPCVKCQEWWDEEYEEVKNFNGKC